MVYFILVVSVITTSIVRCSQIKEESQVLLKRDSESSDYITIPLEDTPADISDSAATGNLVSHFNDIKKFLDSHAQEFHSEKELFNKYSLIKWHGFTNSALMNHVRTKIMQLNTTQTRVVNPLTVHYLELLKDLITYSKTHNKKQKKELCKKITITVAGTAVTAVVPYLVTHFS